MKLLQVEDLKPKLNLPDFRTTDDLEPIKGFIGQERAERALRFGLKIEKDNFHVFAAGKSGTGKLTMIKTLLEDIVKDMPIPNDWLYVHNFKNPSEPKAISLPAGKGKELKDDVNKLVRDVRESLKKAFEDDSYVSRKESIMRKYIHQKEEHIKKLQEKAASMGFILQVAPGGFLLIPTIGGKPLSQEDLQSLDEAIKKKIDEDAKKMEEEISQAMKAIRKLDKELREELTKLDEEVAKNAVSDYFEELRGKYKDYSEVISWLDEAQEDILKNVEVILKSEEDDRKLQKYKVNLFVDNSGLKGAPVIFEPNPTLPNLVGRIEKEMFQGILITDFTMITPGALHKANGGYLIIDVLSLLKEPFAYETLKKVMSNKKIIIEDVYQRLGIGTRTLRPEPIPFKGKVVLVGEPLLYYLLYNFDPEFAELFKVKAEFDISTNISPEITEMFCRFIATVIKEEKLLPWDREGVRELLEYAIRYIGDKRKLPTQFSWLKNVIIEVDFWSRERGKDLVTAEDVKYAIEQIRYRSNLIETKIREYIDRGIIIVDVEGEKTGVINGLAVLDLGDFSFGKPSRITATAGLGKEGIIDIEKEVGLGGKIHSKGVMILSGYFVEKYGGDFPLSFHARLTFEQSYGLVEGDSASAAELIALISELSGIPIRQYIAITGSVNQKGEIQPIGGVNEKVEGFYYTLKARGKLDGNCGVVIPRRNVDNLVLRDEVVQAVSEGKFKIWAVDTIDEAIEILTGEKPEKVHEKVKERLKGFYETVKKLEEELKGSSKKRKGSKRKSSKKKA